jgi:lipoprotein-releasing system permease protein
LDDNRIEGRRWPAITSPSVPSSMTLPFELHVALRYLIASRRQALISVISLVSTLGVIVGVMALVIALALMTGLQGELRDRILGSTAHIYVSRPGGMQDYQAEVTRLKAVPRVTGAAPAILGKALAQSARGEAFITVKGIDPALEPEVTAIAGAIEPGRLQALGNGGEDDLPGILLGRNLAAQLGVTVGGEVTLLTPQGTLSPMGMMTRQRRFHVTGVFALGLLEIDAAYGLVTLPVAARLFDRADIDMIQLRVDDIYAAPSIAAGLSETLGGGYIVQDWADLNQTFFSALWLEKVAISIAIGLIVMVAALNIIASLILLVMEKSRDIAILKTMGARSRSITGIFMLQGLIIGLVGTTIGATAGYAVAYFFDRYQLIRIPMDVYQVSHLPFVVLPLDFALVVLSAILVCFLATVYPSRKAASLDPAQALRYQ